MPENTKRVQFYTNTMAHWKVKQFCERNNLTIAAFCRTAITRLLAAVDATHANIHQLQIIQDIRAQEDPPCQKRALPESISISKKNNSSHI